MNRIDLSWSDVYIRAKHVANKIRSDRPHVGTHRIYGVPNGGIFASIIVHDIINAREPVPSLLECLPNLADVIVDDIIDSGKTRSLYTSRYQKPFYSLLNKERDGSDTWFSMPWERMARCDGPEDNIRRILQFIGEDPNREGLRETPARVVRSYKELFAGYKQDPGEIMKVFEDGACDEMVLLQNIQFTSFCEHHILPFTGFAHIAYLPRKRVIGVSKLARLLEIYSRRLQIQERLGQQITKALDDGLLSKGSACVIEATHTCMSCRGVQKQHAIMKTSSLSGAFRDDPKTRAEFFQLIKG